MPEIIVDDQESDEHVILLEEEDDAIDDDDELVEVEDDDDPEEEEEAEEAPPPPPKPAPKRRRKRKPRTSNQAASVNDPLKRRTRADDESISDWLSSFGGTPMKVVLRRESPAVWDGVPCRGVVMTYDDMVSEEEIMMQHGGGKYQLTVRARRESGKYVYAGATTFEISGSPRVAGTTSKKEPAAPVGPSPVDTVLSTMQTITQNANERADRAERNSGTDMAMVQQLLAPLQAQLVALQAQLAEKDARLLDIASKPVDTAPQDRMFSIMETKESAHSNALTAVRMEHNAEMRSLRDFQKEELSRREARFERELDFVREASQREVDTLKLAHTQAFDSQRLGYETRIDGLKDAVKRLEREADATKKELAELRGKKDIGPIDQIQNLVTLKQGFEALVPSGSDEPARSGMERAAEVIMQSPLAAGIAARIAGPAPGDVMPYQEEPAAEDPNELVAFERPDGKIVQIPRHMIGRIKAAKAAKEAQEAAAAGQGGAGDENPPLPDLNPADVARAVEFIEGAVRNGTPPEIFARTARNMVPEGILVYIKKRGVDDFLNNVAQLQTGSPLTDVAGRIWARKVAKFLLEGTTEGVEPPPTSPVDSQ